VRIRGGQHIPRPVRTNTDSHRLRGGPRLAEHGRHETLPPPKTERPQGA
jgi:hypothetical protein